jgi:hypothetical protein
MNQLTSRPAHQFARPLANSKDLSPCSSLEITADSQRIVVKLTTRVAVYQTSQLQGQGEYNHASGRITLRSYRRERLL